MTIDKRFCATIEARMNSSRLPGKVMMRSAGKPLLEHMVERLRRVPSLHSIIIATTTNPLDDVIVDLALEINVDLYRGNENDVMLRVLEAAKIFHTDVIVETTGDCPLIDPSIVEQVINTYKNSNSDYASNVLSRSYPRGMDVEVFSAKLLSYASSETSDPSHREHVSTYFWENPNIYSLTNVFAPSHLNRPDIRLTLDTIEDYDVINRVFSALYPIKNNFLLSDIIAFLDENPDIQKINENVRQKPIR